MYVCMYVCARCLRCVSVCLCVCVCVCAPDRTNKCFPIDMYGSGQNLDEIQSYARTHNLPVRNPTLPGPL
jgi:hypothetical protein